MSESGIFKAAIKLSAEQRAAYLDQACSGNAELRREVESLIRAHESNADFLNPPAGMPTAAYRPIAEGPGTIIGSYKLLQQIGEGGFGVVFMAEQERPVRRMVALKIIKPGMDTAAVIARFESERQALALMDHPNIAKVLEAGATESGRPYFVMELVKGVPITEFCDKNHLPPETRLKLFVDVCRAIQHAHHKGVIHRDIKPSNVLITLHDGAPVVKVIDFGVAKATVQKLTEKTLFTAYGQMVGTPAYMSPEQAEMSGLDIDTRSDVYSLGVLLYELLTGTTPLELKRLREAGYAEMQRLIREEEAPRPSTRFSSLGDSATVLAGNRGLDAKNLARLLAGDLDWVVMKALEKDRNRRYGTPGHFAEDIERYLRGEIIDARPPTTLYRCRKFVRRNRALVYGTAACLAMLGVAFGGTAWGLIRSQRAEQRARTDELRARGAEQLADERLVEIGKKRDAAIREKMRADDNAHRFEMAATLEESRRLAALSEATRPTNPGQALLLAIRSAAKTRSASTNNALLAAVRQCREIRTIYAAPYATPEGRTGQTQFQAVQVTPDGTHAVVVPVRSHDPASDFYLARASDASAEVYDLATGQMIAAMKLAGLPFRIMAISPDGTLLATATDQGAIVWHVDGKVVAYTDEAIRLWNLRSGKQIRVLRGHTNRVSSLCWDAKGDRLLSASWDGTARIWDVATGKAIHVLTDGEFSLSSAVFSPDGQRVLTNVTHQRMQGNNPPKEEIGRIPGQNPVRPEELAIDPEHIPQAATRRLWPLTGTTAGGNSAGAPCLWNAGTGEKLVDFEEHKKKNDQLGRYMAAGFSADGERVLTVDSEKIEIWNARDGRPVTDAEKLKAYPAVVRDGNRIFRIGTSSPTIFADSTGLLIWQSDRAQREWRTSPVAKSLNHWSASAENSVGQVLDTSNSSLPLAAISAGETVIIRDATNWSPFAELRGHEGKVFGAAFFANGKRLVTVSLDGSLRTWNLEPKIDPVIEMGRRQDKPFGAGWFVDAGRKVLRAPLRDEFSRYAGSFATLWDSASGAFVAEAYDSASLTATLRQKVLHGDLRDLDVSPDGERLATVHLDSNPCANPEDEPKPSPDYTPVRIWDIHTGKLICALEGFRRSVATARFSPDGTRLLTFADGNYHYAVFRNGKPFGGGSGGDLWARTDIWDARTGKHIRSIVPEARGGGDFAIWSPDGKRVLTNAQSHVDNVAADIYDAETGARLRRLPGIGVDHAAFSPDGKRILGYRVHFLKNQISVDVWDAETMRHLELKGHTGVITFAEFSPDSQSIVTASTDGTARLWDASSGQARFVLRGHRNTIHTARFSPDGRWIATASADGTARIWSVDGGQEWMALPAGPGETANAEFAPDSRRILTVCQNIARIWPLDPLPIAASRKPRELTADEKSRFQAR